MLVVVIGDEFSTGMDAEKTPRGRAARATGHHLNGEPANEGSVLPTI